MKQDTNWDDRMGELCAALFRVDPALPSLIPLQPEFGLPAHTLYLSQSPAAVIPQAIAGFLRHFEQNPDAEWTNDVVFVIGESGEARHKQLLREQLENLSVRDAVLIVLAESPERSDREHFVAGLDSPQLNVVEACLNALTKLPRTQDPQELFALLAAARRLMNDKREYRLRETALRLLQNNTEQTLGFVFGEAGFRPQPESLMSWQQWLEARFPDFRPVNQSEEARQLLALEKMFRGIPVMWIADDDSTSVWDVQSATAAANHWDRIWPGSREDLVWTTCLLRLSSPIGISRGDIRLYWSKPKMVELLAA
ncbi:MAG UNVERIFIED_CONTAM: hypothetical protein LVR18_04570 [Planctomycetaceae bacterium]|jgi:hypothetical protein